MKKLFAILAAFLLLLTACAAAEEALFYYPLTPPETSGDWAYRLLDDGEIGFRELVAVRLDQGVEHRHLEILQNVVRLGSFGLVVASGEYPYVQSGLPKIFDCTPCGGRKAVSGGVEIVYYEQYFHKLVIEL